MEKLELQNIDTMTTQEKDLYRTLRTNVEFSGIENKVIVITSCNANDGKSTVSFNLSLSIADNKKKVLYIDADLRKSVFNHRKSVAGNPKGLSHFLSGQCSLQDVIYSTNKNFLYVIPTGIFPRNPTELLGNGRLEKALVALKETFDYIIIDAPPMGLVVDAAVIAKYSDASILVVAANKSSKADLKSVISQIRFANPNFLGVVLNKVETTRGTYYGRKYGGYYGYGYYGYGYNHTDSNDK